MTKKRKVDVFTAGCPVCEGTIALVNSIACPSCEVSVLDMNDPDVASQAKRIGVSTVPAVAVDGELVSCCVGGGPEESSLRGAGIGQVA